MQGLIAVNRGTFLVGLAIFELISVFVGVTEGCENEKTHQNVDGFLLVAGTGLEPVTFGL